MATVVGITLARAEEIAGASVVSGSINGSGHLILTKGSGAEVDAGQVVPDAVVSGAVNGSGNLILTKEGGGTIDAGQVKWTTAGGVLGGTYPNPSLANSVVSLSKLASDVLAFLVPTGAVLPFAGTTAPTGFLLCTDTARSRTTYANLFALIGTTYGLGAGGDGTTFGTPDMRNRSVVGVSGTKALGASSGAETVTLSAANLPSHVHTMNHRHDAITAGTGGGDIEWDANAVTVGGSSGATGTGATPLVTSIFTGNTGGGPGTSTAFNIMNPYVALNYIIKT